MFPQETNFIGSKDILINREVRVVEEISDGLMSPSALQEKLSTGEAIILNGRRRNVAIGHDLLVKVNTSVGLNGAATAKNISTELGKVQDIASLGYAPDLMMDLSIRETEPPMYEQIVEIFGGPIGTLPHYLIHKGKKGLDPELLLRMVEKQAEAGVAFMTLHPTPTRELYELALRTRRTAITSRGGGLVVDDMLKNSRDINLIESLFPEILQILKANKVAVSIGTTFRPANVIDALDIVHRQEYERQGIFIQQAKQAGVAVMMEGVGHMTLDKIPEYANMIKAYKVPFMPLGPITTDAAVGEDHISNAIGATYMAILGGAHVFNCVTREEHTGKVPSHASIIEALRAARIAEHSVNISRFRQKLEPDIRIADDRAANYTCVVEGGIFTQSAKRRFAMGCTRCSEECPLLVNNRNNNIGNFLQE